MLLKIKYNNYVHSILNTLKNLLALLEHNFYGIIRLLKTARLVAGSNPAGPTDNLCEIQKFRES